MNKLVIFSLLALIAFSCHALEMPTAKNGFINTLNNMGYMTEGLDPISEEFTDFACQSTKVSLDIGAAYGVASLAALKKGANIISNDIEEKHLKILMSRTPEAHLNQLSLAPGKFPDDLDFKDSSINAILIARVLHFFDGETIGKSLKKMHNWLIPGGKVFVVVETPYLKNWQSFIPVFLERKKAGNPWPGLILNTKKYATSRAKNLPPLVHWFDPDTLKFAFEKNGYIVEKAIFMDRTDFPVDMRLDGRESVGLVAYKPNSSIPPAICQDETKA